MYALAADLNVPDAGKLLQQIPPRLDGDPLSRLPGLMIEGADGTSARLPTSAPFMVQRIRITRNTIFDTATLLELVAHAQGKTITLPQLGELAGLITNYYRSHGYPLTRAIIPAQTIAAGLVRIEVIEAKLGEVKLENSSRVRDAVLQSTLSSLQTGQDISQAELDHTLLLLSDMAGVTVNASMRPGQVTGTSDLIVSTRPEPRVSGDTALDNYGNNYTGTTRTGGNLTINNPLNSGDTLNLSLLTSGRGMNYGRVAYETVASNQGTRLGASYSALEYLLGGPLAPLQAYGNAQVQSVWLRKPLLRSQTSNVYAQLQYDLMTLRDRIAASGIQTDRSLDNVILSLSGDARDQAFSGGVNSWNLAVTSGHLRFDNSAAQALNAATARTEGQFSKWNVNLGRLQSLTPKTSLYLRFAAQGTNTNLDSTQKMSAGGPYGVRAYDSGAISGDAGYVMSADMRYELGSALRGQWQLSAFADSAYVITNKNSWTPGVNDNKLNGVGMGLKWTSANQWTAAATLAKSMGSAPPLANSKNSARLWLDAHRGF
jgi:hemolysin activation/secretion protein